MGWLWSSSSSGDDGQVKAERSNESSTNDRNWGLTEEQRQRIFGKSSVLQSTDERRDKDADKDLEEFWNSLSESDASTSRSATNRVVDEPSQTKPKERTDHDRLLPDGTVNISPMALHPRTMSCRQAFDQAFYCQSMGGKFNDVYRFGQIQSCSEQWGQFWFCMRTKSLPKEERERQIRDYYAAREERKKKQFGSSENVWDIREKAVERAFNKNEDDEGV